MALSSNNDNNKIMPLKHLHHKLVFYVLCSALFIATIAISLSFMNEFNRSKERTVITLNQLMDTVEKTAAIAAYSRDKVIAQDVIEGLLRNDIIYQASISSEQQLLASKSKQTPSEFPQQYTRSLYSPFAQQQLIGQLSISPNKQFSVMEARYAAFSSAASSLLLIFSTTAILLILVRSYISTPLLNISDTVHSVQVGEKTRIPILSKHRDNELGRLIDDINDLLKRQEIKYKQESILRKSVQHMEQQLRHIFDSSSAGLFLLNNKGQLISHNSTFLRVLHCKKQPDLTFTDSVFANSFIKEESEFKLMLRNALQSGELQAQDFSIRHNQDSTVWVHCLLSKVADHTGEERIEGVIFDVSKRVSNEQATKHQAEHDSLTGLLLRQAIREHFESYLIGDAEAEVSVFVLDLDGFKQANDTYGHDVGDNVLVQTAKRLIACVRTDDLVCRLGGDEFLVIVFNNNDQIALNIAKNMVLNIQKPMVINDDLTVQVGVSIGIAISPEHGQDFDILVKAADAAMYEVKHQGKNGYGIRVSATQINVKLF
ncbi:MAG: diguanylate cyclase [Methyloprofundus sp.]|nr:diguanylate cyclase [Methyloprofundus sp.]